MQFNSDLYWALGEVFPTMTVRSLSKMMGKSSGYWSSVNAQQQAIGTSALVHLLDYLECQKIQASFGSSKRQILDRVSGMITHELVTRFEAQTGLETEALFKSQSHVNEDNHGPMPFIVTSY